MSTLSLGTVHLEVHMYIVGNAFLPVLGLLHTHVFTFIIRDGAIPVSVSVSVPLVILYGKYQIPIGFL